MMSSTKVAKMNRFRQLPRDSLLAGFLSRHHRHEDPLCRGFITRRDRSSLTTKRITFIKAFVSNIFLFTSAAALGTVNVTWDLFSPELPFYLRLAANIIQNLIVASVIILVLRTTTIPFFLGECRLRIKYGFRPSEIIIRSLVSPTSFIITNDEKGRRAKATENQRMERYWRMAIRSINPALLYSNPGAMLSSDYWTMEYRALFDAQTMIASGALEEDSFEFSIYERDKEDGWTVCELWRMHEIMHDQQEIILFKAFLAKSGKEKLLAVWKEMLPDAHAPTRRGHERTLSTTAYQAVVDKFAREGLDYDTMWSVLAVS